MGFRNLAMTDDFNAIEDTWRSIWYATALTDPRSTVDPDLAVERHREWCERMENGDDQTNT